MSNRLQHESSPYLQQHAGNPVDWYPWGEEAFEKAQAENKVVLVSIGYSSCHWCHVMEHESFDDPATAEFMNKHFVNIKVDREERPDIDQIYMDAVQAMTGSGGWPLNVFLTPEKLPFYGGTYFPPQRAYNRISWLELLENIRENWERNPQDIQTQAGNLLQYLQNANQTSISGTAPTRELLHSAAQQIMKLADTEWGGFGRAPKFPQTMTITWLMRQYYFLKKEDNGESEETEKLLEQAVLSLDSMHKGGIYDHLGGGFARYSVDALWHAPHFEKMLYDNALLVLAYTEAWKLTGKKSFKNAIHATIRFVLHDWLDARGGFYSAYDADSEGHEGKFYTWTKAEIAGIIGDENMTRKFCEHYQVKEGGNWEGTNILWLNRNDWPDDELDSELETARQKLLENRQHRIKPLLDDKIILYWNALMISALCKASQAWPGEGWMDAALQTVNRIETGFRRAEGLYAHHIKDKHQGVPAFLDDLAQYGLALMDCTETTGDFTYLDKAIDIVEYLMANFREPGGVFFHYASGQTADLVIQKKELYDGATPAANSTMAHLLWKAGKMAGKPEWINHAAAMCSAVATAFGSYPTSFSNWGMLAQFMVYGYKELVIIGNEAEDNARSILTNYLPALSVMASQTPVLSGKYPSMSGKKMQNESITYYVCEDFVCKEPLNSRDKALEVL